MGITPISGIHSTTLLIFPLPLIPLNFLYIIRFAAGLHYSSIVGNNLTFLAWLGKWLKPVTNQSSYWNHCYQTTVNGWSSNTFHLNCDAKGPSVTIIRVGKYIFGGYTSVPWSSKLPELFHLNRRHKQKLSCESAMITLRYDCTWFRKRKYYLILCSL